MTADRIWYILGKKLTNEASDQELEEFSAILSQHAKLHYPLQYICDWWMFDKQNDKQLAINALQAHLLRRVNEQGEILFWRKKTAHKIKKRFWIKAGLYSFQLLRSLLLHFYCIGFPPNKPKLQ